MRTLFAMLLLSAGCSVADPDLGLHASLRVDGAQFVPGAMPPAGAGPSVSLLSLQSANLPLGVSAVNLFGTLGTTATAAWIGLEGDAGYWVVLAGIPDSDSPMLPSLHATVGISPDAIAGMRVMEVRGADDRGSGASGFLDVTLVDTGLPSGKLVFALSWDGLADLDLHVVDPRGDEVWAQHPVVADGFLDGDAHGGCVADGRQAEDGVFSAPGSYIVRVDTFSMCGAASAAWRVDVFVDGTRVDGASGLALPSDTRGVHQRGSGVTALTFGL